MDRSDLAVRMKENYESCGKTKLTRRVPVAIRIDGKAFHSFTRNFKRPFDEILIKSMQETMKYLCENVQNCVIGYHQSDEITLILIDDKRLDTAAWFDNERDKIISISASMATMAFNKFFAKNVEEFRQDCATDYETQGLCGEGTKEWKLCDVYSKAVEKGAMFDSRAFSIPKDEVTNLVYWRQDDAARNSIQMVGQANFSQKELHGKSRSDIQDMLMLQKGINWNDFPTYQKRGSCCIKEKYIVKSEDGNEVERSRWIIDQEIPIFTGEGRDYVESRIYFKGEDDD